MKPAMKRLSSSECGSENHEVADEICVWILLTRRQAEGADSGVRRIAAAVDTFCDLTVDVLVARYLLVD
jgi:hypothetical protein